MRVMLVIDSLGYGGAERHVVDLARALRGRGHDVAVACSAGGPLASEITDDGVPVRVLMADPVKRRASLLLAWRLRSLIEDFTCDLVHAHIYASEVAAALATTTLKTPLVVTEHSEGEWRPRRARLCSSFAYARASRIVAVSWPIAARLSSEFGVADSRITVIPPVVTPFPLGSRGTSSRHPGGRVGVVARLEREKGVDVFLRAAAELASRFGDVRFYVVGSGSERPALERLARDLGLAATVRFLGFRRDARRLMTRFNVVVVPSLADGCPLVVQESMLAGAPVVATTAGGIPDHIEDGVDGLLVPPGDAHALAEAVGLLVSDAALAARLASRAAQRAARRSFDQMLNRIESEYRAAVLGKASAPTGVRLPAPERV